MSLDDLRLILSNEECETAKEYLQEKEIRNVRL